MDMLTYTVSKLELSVYYWNMIMNSKATKLHEVQLTCLGEVLSIKQPTLAQQDSFLLNTLFLDILLPVQV